MDKLRKKGFPVPKPIAIFLSTASTNKIGVSYFIREFVEVSI